MHFRHYSKIILACNLMLVLFLLGTGHMIIDAGRKPAVESGIKDQDVEKLHSELLFQLQLRRQTASVGKAIIAATLLVSIWALIGSPSVGRRSILRH